jgi:hypothetical protein
VSSRHCCDEVQSSIENKMDTMGGVERFWGFCSREIEGERRYKLSLGGERFGKADHLLFGIAGLLDNAVCSL